MFRIGEFSKLSMLTIKALRFYEKEGLADGDSVAGQIMRKIPDNEGITINGETYVHWNDCISDYIL